MSFKQKILPFTSSGRLGKELKKIKEKALLCLSVNHWLLTSWKQCAAVLSNEKQETRKENESKDDQRNESTSSLQTLHGYKGCLQNHERHGEG